MCCNGCSNVKEDSNDTVCYNGDTLKEKRCNFSDDSETTKNYHSGKLGESNGEFFEVHTISKCCKKDLILCMYEIMPRYVYYVPIVYDVFICVCSC